VEASKTRLNPSRLSRFPVLLSTTSPPYLFLARYSKTSYVPSYPSSPSGISLPLLDFTPTLHSTQNSFLQRLSRSYIVVDHYILRFAYRSVLASHILLLRKLLIFRSSQLLRSNCKGLLLISTAFFQISSSLPTFLQQPQPFSSFPPTSHSPWLPLPDPKDVFSSPTLEVLVRSIH
jgi:hypothetical protein